MLLKKYEVYNLQEFLNKDNKNYANDIKLMDKMIGHLKRNKKKYILLVTILALVLDFNCIKASALLINATEENRAIDVAGMQILTLVRQVGYWLCIILCAKDVVKKSMKGNMDSIGTVVTMYGMTFGTLYFLPWLFDLIKQVFQ